MLNYTMVGRSLAVLIGLFGVAAASAQSSVEADAVALPNSNIGVEIVHGRAELREIMKPVPDTDSLDTALVFTNPRRHRTLVWCYARNADGRVVGRGHTFIPALGLRFILASDIANGADYLGSAQCHSRANVVPSAFVIGAAFSDGPAEARQGWDGSTAMRFPVVVTN